LVSEIVNEIGTDCCANGSCSLMGQIRLVSRMAGARLSEQVLQHLKTHQIPYEQHDEK
jgi:predicted ATP-dependent serine protease